CSTDGDCPGSERCCSNGCGQECMLPVGGDICRLLPDHGPCKGHFYRYAYNPATGTCQVFLYGGCRGNPNNFQTAEECQRVC
ncbi:EPPI protein, partial [Anseranas semipalmata]|nr:EPPI protein [Anseranas semipalmata]